MDLSGVSPDERLFGESVGILEGNSVGEHTVPAQWIYPFQWLWDSGFIARGISHYDLSRSFTEVQSVFKGQWKNGFIPHIRFDKDTPSNFFPRYEWESQKYSGIDYDTTGTT